MAVSSDEPSPRTGSATSIVLSITGLYVRRLGGWIAAADLVAMATYAGLSEPLARTAVTRLGKGGILVKEKREGIAGYALTPQSERLFDRGDQRIFEVRVMHPDDPWCVISFSLPETLRADRAQLRRRLSRIGCGTVSPALWICPDYLREEVLDILDDLEIRKFAVLFRSDLPTVDGAIEDSIAQWWDLPRIAERHAEFAIRAEQLLEGSPPGDAEAFRRYVNCIDAWRAISYVDPGLPFELLPSNWPGKATVPYFRSFSERYADRAWDFAAELTSRERASAR